MVLFKTFIVERLLISNYREVTVKIKRKILDGKDYGILADTSTGTGKLKRPGRKLLEAERSRQCSAEYTASWVKDIRTQPLFEDHLISEEVHYL